MRRSVAVAVAGALAGVVGFAAPAAADVCFQPGTPTGVVAAAGAGSATVSWQYKSFRPPPCLTQYTVVASPGGGTVTVAGWAAEISGLASGVAYTFRVVAFNAAGSSEPSAPSEPVVPH